MKNYYEKKKGVIGNKVNRIRIIGKGEIRKKW